MGLLFECPEHRDLWELHIKNNAKLDRIECEDCRRIVKAARHQQEVRARYPDHKPRKLTGRFSVAEVGPYGRVIENLTPNPTYVPNKDKYRDLLKRTGSQEAF